MFIFELSKQLESYIPEKFRFWQAKLYTGNYFKRADINSEQDGKEIVGTLFCLGVI